MQAAAIQVFAGEVYPWVDLRVDDHERPVDELNRLYRRHLEADVQQVRATMARRTLESDGPEYPPIGDLSATLETNEERRQRGDPE
jgi:uncharacterized Ntn-hydrolase superfamily protein